jgi:hypothetical protein
MMKPALYVTASSQDSKASVADSHSLFPLLWLVTAKCSTCARRMDGQATGRVFC